MKSVLFVCLGNICRSPLAEALFKEHCRELNVSQLFQIDSAGTGAFHIGSLADPRTRITAAQLGVELTHRARQLQQSDFHSFNYLIAMDQNNLNYLVSNEPSGSTATLLLLRSFDPEANGEINVPDPYHGSEQDFQLVQEIIQRSTLGLLRYMQANN